jgi:hypothetical protein
MRQTVLRTVHSAFIVQQRRKTSAWVSRLFSFVFSLANLLCSQYNINRGGARRWANVAATTAVVLFQLRGVFVKRTVNGNERFGRAVRVLTWRNKVSSGRDSKWVLQSQEGCCLFNLLEFNFILYSCYLLLLVTVQWRDCVAKWWSHLACGGAVNDVTGWKWKDGVRG